MTCLDENAKRKEYPISVKLDTIPKNYLQKIIFVDGILVR